MPVPPAASCDPAQCPHLDDLADRVAQHAVGALLAHLGVNAANPREVEEFRRSLRFAQDLRRAADRGFGALVTLFAAAVGAVLWTGLAGTFGGDKP